MMLAPVRALAVLLLLGAGSALAQERAQDSGTQNRAASTVDATPPGTLEKVTLPPLANPDAPNNSFAGMFGASGLASGGSVTFSSVPGGVASTVLAALFCVPESWARSWASAEPAPRSRSTASARTGASIISSPRRTSPLNLPSPGTQPPGRGGDTLPRVAHSVQLRTGHRAARPAPAAAARSPDAARWRRHAGYGRWRARARRAHAPPRGNDDNRAARAPRTSDRRERALHRRAGGRGPIEIPAAAPSPRSPQHHRDRARLRAAGRRGCRRTADRSYRAASASLPNSWRRTTGSDARTASNGRRRWHSRQRRAATR